MRSLRYFRWWLAIGWLAVAGVVYFSLAPLPFDLSVRNGDKLGHLMVYALLMGWFVQLYSRRNTLLLYALFLTMQGIVLEFLQPYTGRYFEYADMLANSGGVALGLIVGLTPLRRLLVKLEQRLSAA